MMVYIPPRILTLHLNRFMQTTKGIRKIGQHVTFPSEFNLGPYCNLSDGYMGSTRYRLYAVVGTYTCVLGC